MKKTIKNFILSMLILSIAVLTGISAGIAYGDDAVIDLVIQAEDAQSTGGVVYYKENDSSLDMLVGFWYTFVTGTENISFELSGLPETETEYDIEMYFRKKSGDAVYKINGIVIGEASNTTETYVDGGTCYYQKATFSSVPLSATKNKVVMQRYSATDNSTTAYTSADGYIEVDKFIIKNIGSNVKQTDYTVKSTTSLGQNVYKIEAENVLNSKGKIVENSDCSGGFCVTEISASNSNAVYNDWLRLKFTAETAGSYKIGLKAKVLTDTAILDVFFYPKNEMVHSASTKRSLNLVKTDGYDIINVQADLAKGDNYIFISLWRGECDYDYIEIKDDNIDRGPETGYTRYEAEDAAIVNAEVLTDGILYSGDAFVAGINLETSSVLFTVNAVSDGMYKIKIAYASAETESSFKIYVTGKHIADVFFEKSGNWGTFGDSDNASYFGYCTIPLKAGKNNVRIGKGTSYAQIDFIDVANTSIGEYVDPVDVKAQRKKNANNNGWLFNAEDFVITGGEVDTDVVKLSAGGSVTCEFEEFFNLTEFENAGKDFTLRFTYRATSDTGVKVAYNGVDTYDEAVLATNGDTAKIEIPVDCIKGTNTFTLTADGDIEIISAEFLFINASDDYYRYEAEDGVSVGYGVEFKGYGSANYGFYSGTGFIGSNNGTNQILELKIYAKEDGEYQLRVAYACSEDAVVNRMDIVCGKYVLGNIVCDPAAASLGSYGEFYRERLYTSTIMLKAGENVIQFIGNAETFELDYVEIGAKCGEYVASSTIYDDSVGNYEYQPTSTSTTETKKKGCGAATDNAISIMLMVFAFAGTCVLKRK